MPSEDIKVAKQVLREALATPFGVFDGDEVAEAIRALLAHVDKLEGAIQRCRSQFGFYAEQHMAKSPPDVAKAKTNASFVDLCATALSSPAPVKEEVRPVEGRTYTQAEVDSILRAAFAGDRGKQAEMRLNPPPPPEARREEIARVIHSCDEPGRLEDAPEAHQRFCYAAADAILALKD